MRRFLETMSLSSPKEPSNALAPCWDVSTAVILLREYVCSGGNGMQWSGTPRRCRLFDTLVATTGTLSFVSCETFADILLLLRDDDLIGKAGTSNKKG